MHFEVELTMYMYLIERCDLFICSWLWTGLQSWVRRRVRQRVRRWVRQRLRRRVRQRIRRRVRQRIRRRVRQRIRRRVRLPWFWSGRGRFGVCCTGGWRGSGCQRNRNPWSFRPRARTIRRSRFISSLYEICFNILNTFHS